MINKILFIHPVLASYSSVFFNELVKNGFDVSVAADIKTSDPLNQYDSRECEFTVKHLENKKMGPFFYRPGLNKIIDTIKPEMVVYLGNPRDLSQLLRMFTGWLNGEQFAVWSMFHRIGGPRLYSELIYRVFGRIAQINLCYSRVGALSQVCRGVPSKKIAVLGTAINEHKVIVANESIGSDQLYQFKVAHNLLDKKVILQVVRLSKIKKPERLIEAMKRIVKINPSVIAVLIGGGELLEKIKREVLLSGLEKNIRLLGPIYDESVLANWYRSCHAFVVPTCIGLSAHHAMLYSCTVITDADYAVQASEFELIVDGHTGRTYDPWVENSLSDTILNVIANENDSRRIGIAANQAVQFGYSLRQKGLNFKNALLRIGGQNA